MKFNFTPVSEKRKVARERVIEKLIEGTIVQIDKQYMFKANSTSNALPLTRRSYSCDGFRTVYATFLDKNGKYIKVIRNNSFGAPKCYVPFKPGLKVKGYLRIEDNIEKFDLRENGCD